MIVLALAAFAANSVLCRFALRDATIDPATFSTIRIVSGAVTLALVALAARSRTGETTSMTSMPAAASWLSAALLFLYAVPFSFAYTTLSAGTGALILFGAVQVTMLAGAIRSGERVRFAQWSGLILALAGLVYLVVPGIAAPPIASAALMALAGIAWGLYSLRGRGAPNPLAQTTSSFVRAVPMVVAVSAATFSRAHAEPTGIALAVASGSVTSGLGYVAWYAALRRLTALRASVVQLSVPVIAAVAGVIFLSETISSRLIVSAILVLGGIALAVVRRAQ